MAAIFQLRRGSGSVSLVDGELYVNKGPDSLQYAVNDREITLAKLDETNNGSFNLNGDITASNAYFTNNVKIDGKITVGNETGDTLNIVASLSSSLIPSGSKLFDLGSQTNYYKSLYVETISSSFISGSIAGVGSIEIFSASIDSRVDKLEASASLYDNAMSGSKRLYVSPSGSDTNDGKDPSTPFKTIKMAVASLGSAVYTNTQRYTIFVGSGEYTEENPIVVPPGVSIVGDTLRTVRLTPIYPTKDFFHCHDSNYFYGLRFLDLKHPAFAFSFPSSTATGSISAGGISSIRVVHSMTGYTDGNNQDLGIIIEGPNNSGSIATATANVYGGIISQINIVNPGTNYADGEKPHISIPAPIGQRPVITTSPYVQNCSSITGPFNKSGVKIPILTPLPYDEVVFDVDEQGAGGGIRIDGNLTHPNSPLESFVADAFTQVNQGGPGHLVINKGYAQFVSCFTTFCTYGFKVANGGFANISNSVIDFGKYGLISKTYFPQTYNQGLSLETKTSTVSGFRIDENGAGYTGSVAGVTITGGGASVQATAEATVNANGSIDEIVLLTLGSGYTTQPSVTIDTPTGPGAIQATTVAGKALITGVTEILMALESGSRGVDISSNMILNGIDYLVTDVQSVSGQPNRRKVTTYPAPPSVQTNDQIKFHQLSNISTGGLVMEYVGSGVTYNALPKYGGVPIRTREINEFAPGRVFYSTVDNIGNLKIGDFFAVNQLTGEVSIDANSFNLRGLNNIGPFRRNGVAVGVELAEVSNNTTLLNSQGLYGEDTVPTQYAVKEYIALISQSFDDRTNELEQTASNYESRIDLLEISSASVNSFTQSANNRLNNLESKSASVDISISNLHSYTSSLNNAIQLTGSTVSFLGNIIVYGTQSVINSTNLEVADNMIYLNSTSSTTNVDLGIVGNYNDGTYAHTGIYRDSLDGVWRVFKGYTPEPGGNIDLSHASYRYADFYANALSASTLNGIGNITSYSTSVNSRLVSLETNSTNVGSSISNLNLFSASVTASLEKIYQTTSSLNSATQSLYTSASLMTASISQLTSSVVLLQSFSGNVDTRFNNLQTYTTSVNSRFTTLATYTGSVDTRLSEIGVVTGSLISSASAVSSSVWNLFQVSASQSTQNYNLKLYTGSVETRFTEIGVVSGSLILSASAVSSSVWNLNRFSASATNSIVELYWTSSDHEDRIDYLETVAGIGGGVSPSIRLNNLEFTSASLKTSIAELNSWSASAKIELSNLETKSASVDISIANLNTFTASSNTSFTQLNSWSASAKIELSNLESTTSSLNSFSSSINTTIKTKLDAEGIISSSNQLTSTFDTRYLNTNGDNVISSSAQIGNYVATITGTANQITVAGSGANNASVTLSTPQSIATTSDVTFNNITASAGIRAIGDVIAYATSDERLKENIQPIKNALSKVELISGNTYDWKEGFENIHPHKGNDIGVIAQEIEKILPQVVIERENGYKAVDYEKIIPLLIESIKELSIKIKELENK
jgi:uncharacterized coiled-coil protein SlyX